MKKTYEEVIGVEAMVDKVLTKDDVINLYGEYAKNRKYYNQTIEYPTISGFVNNITYHNWDGIDHDGVLVVVKESADTESDYYFMERTWDFTGKQAIGSHMAAIPVWHALLPVNLKRSKEVSKIRTKRHLLRLETEGFDTKEFAELIVDKCIVDDITFPDNNENGFSENDIEATFYFESEEKKREYEKWKGDAVKRLMSGEVPAGDELWDDLCIGQLSTECIKIFEALRRRGHHVCLDGERDSFGWVTCGIVMDGKLMTSMYF